MKILWVRLPVLTLLCSCYGLSSSRNSFHTGIYQQILTGKVRFTRSFDKNAKSLTKKLLQNDLTKRYGCLKLGAQDIKLHRWFADFDWQELLGKKLEAPIIPELSSNTDTSNFEEYPEDLEEPKPPEFEDGIDPFEDF